MRVEPQAHLIHSAAPPLPQPSGHSCESCHTSCLECRGPGLANCTVCPPQAILEARGRCLLCCQRGDEEGEESASLQQDCCNCTETRGERLPRTAPGATVSLEKLHIQ